MALLKKEGYTSVQGPSMSTLLDIAIAAEAPPCFHEWNSVLLVVSTVSLIISLMNKWGSQSYYAGPLVSLLAMAYYTTLLAPVLLSPKSIPSLDQWTTTKTSIFTAAMLTAAWGGVFVILTSTMEGNEVRWTSADSEWIMCGIMCAMTGGYLIAISLVRRAIQRVKGSHV